MEPTPAFLDQHAIAASAVEAGLNQQATQTLSELAQRISADPQLTLVVAAAHQRVYESSEDFGDVLRRADAALGAEADVLHALFVLDSIRLVHQHQGARGVPEAISRAVNQRHGVAWLKGAAAQGGRIGIADWIPWWFRTIGSGHLYRLGRLEFVPERWRYPFRAYRHVRTQEVVVLAEAGLQLNATGRRAGASSWTATLVEDDAAIIGTPITPQGVALPQRVYLPRNEWQLALGQGDAMLDIHVPGEGALSLEALGDALAQAGPFFARFYPEHHFVAYVCDSWLFSPQLEAMLGPDSNIVRWQREGYLLPSDDGADSFLSFTFGADNIDTATAPRDTRLRRAVIAHLEDGGALECGVYLLLRDDLERFGSQPYRGASERAIARFSNGEG